MAAFVSGVSVAGVRNAASIASRRPVGWAVRDGARSLTVTHMTLTPVREEVQKVEEEQVQSASDQKTVSWNVQLLYDSDCPLCMREVNYLTRKDGGRGLIDFVDISDLTYNPEEHQGISYEQAMGHIHAILPDGSIITGIEVFRTVYEALGMGWIYAITKIPAVGKVADSIYNVWADARLRLSGRKDLAELVREREALLAEVSASDCETSCKIEW